MAGLNLPFRGDSRNIDDPNCGVYLSLLKEIAKTNPTLMNHLQSGKVTPEYDTSLRP